MQIRCASEFVGRLGQRRLKTWPCLRAAGLTGIAMIGLVFLTGLSAAEPGAASLAPLPPVPTPRQLAWHRLGYYAFVHFGPNTFTGREWGEGNEPEAVFNPGALDCCRQWVRVFKHSGMKGVIITAKHHDGFCLWPSRQSHHTVARSPWRNGKGDVLRELSSACREAGLKFGVYLSPWDRNHPAYGTPAYNDVFVAMLEEVLGDYGPVFEVWFDGACGEGPNGKKQVYDWARYIATVRRLQSEAVIFSDAGPDVRWVGNENGMAGLTNWALLRRDEFYPGTERYRELTAGHEDGTHYVPAEADVSIRPGWFYQPEEDSRIKTIDQLLEIYYASLGRGANLLLNVPADRRGRITAADTQRLYELQRRLAADFRFDLARGARVSADVAPRPGFGAKHLVDRRDDTYWAAPDGVTQAAITLKLKHPVAFDRVLLQEAVALGQRVREFTVDVQIAGQWQTVATGTTIGFRRILPIPPARTDQVRLRILDARACPVLARVGLYASPETRLGRGQTSPR